MEMNWLLEGVNLNTIWTSIIFLVTGYFVGSFLFSRVWISLVRKGDASYIDKEGNKKEIERFGTSFIAMAMGPAFAVAQFFTDFFKSVIVLWSFVWPLMAFVPTFGTAISGTAILGVVIGHIWPIWWKGKGGIGVAAGVGAIFAVNWVVGFVGFMVWVISSAVTKDSAIGGILGTVTGVSLMFIPSMMLNKMMSYELFFNSTIGITTFIYPWIAIFTVMMFKFRYAVFNVISSWTTEAIAASAAFTKSVTNQVRGK